MSKHNNGKVTTGQSNPSVPTESAAQSEVDRLIQAQPKGRTWQKQK